MGKSLPRLCALMLASGIANENDVSPHKVGDALSTEDAQAMLSRYARRPQQPWHEPDPATIPAGPDGDAIREGMNLMLHTSQRVGNRAPDESKRLNWNSLNCVNCHQAGPSGLPGTKKFALALVKMTADKPEFQAIMAYLRWLGSEAKPGQAMEGVGLLPMKPIARAADPLRGKVLYANKCQSCHGADATGQRRPDFDSGGGYLFPPLAGNDTYDNAGHMFAIPLLARYIRASMPSGTQADRPQLTPAQALDIAAYINDDSTPRGQAPHRIRLYPDAALRPQGFAIPEHFVNQPKAYRRAKFGPFRNVNENY